MKKLLVGLSLLCCVGGPLAGQSADTLRFVQYNLLKYADLSCLPLATKNARLKLIFDVLQPDILTVNEMLPSQTAVLSLRTNALSANPQILATAFGNSNGSDIVNMLYYNGAKLGYLGHQAITGNVRDIDIYRLYHLATTHPGDTTDLYCFVAHFKSSQGTTNVAARAAAAQSVVNWLQAHPQIKRYMISGDFNLYSSTEPAFQTLLQRFDDPSGQSNGWQGPTYAALQTQSPADGTDPCAVTGGMDDRFDFILTSPDILDGNSGIRALTTSYRTFGNDGVSYNQYLQCATTTSVSASVCAALRNGSDHLPVTMQLLVQATTPVTQAADPRQQCRLLGNPVNNQLLVRLPEQYSPQASWKILDQVGRLVATGQVQDLSSNLLDVPTQSWPHGMYVFYWQDGYNRGTSLRFVR